MKAETLIKYIGCVLCFLFIAFLGYWYVNRPNADSIKIIVSEFAEGEKVSVTVSGEVKNPGTYNVRKGTTVYDCIHMAGGITKKGDPETVEPDEIVYEPYTIVVGKLSESDTTAYITHKDPSPDNLCDINTATKETLMKLPGIGETLASDIINYRETVGRFQVKEDIMKVNGIGTGKYEEFKDIITVGGAK